MSSFLLVVPMEPVAKGRPRFNTKTGRTYTPSRTQRAEAAIRAAWEASGSPRLPGEPLVLDVVALFARPDSHYLKDGGLSAAGRRAIPGGLRDFDNIAKTVCDALNKLAWPDDRFICEAHISKGWAERGKPPSLQIAARVCTAWERP